MKTLYPTENIVCITQLKHLDGVYDLLKEFEGIKKIDKSEPNIVR